MPHVNAMCQLCKYTILLRRSNEFRKLLDDLKEDWLNATKEDQWILRTRSSIGHRAMMAIAILIYTGGVSLRTIIPLLKGKIVLPNNMTIRHLPCPGHFVFFNEQLTPNYEIIFVLQVVCGLVNYTTLCGTIGVCTMLCLHMCSMLRILANKMIELSNQSNTDEKALQQKIIDIVEHQIKIKRNAEEDLKHSMRLLYPLLKIVGAWPDPVDPAPVSSTILKWGMISISYFLQLLLLIPSFMYIFGKETNSRKQVKLLMPHINGLSQLIKYTILLRRMKEFRETMEEIRNDWLTATDENRRIFRENAKVGYKVVLGIAIIMYAGGLCNRTVMPLSKGRIVLPNNVTIRLLSSQSYFIFFDVQRTPNYEIIFTLQVLGGFIIYTILCGTMGVSSLLCMHMCSLLRILANMMSELSEQFDVSENAVQKKIASIVEYRTKIKK
ncbi:hypothetical protein WN51_13773 [Melipona quadrifasciata]|uniref:Odorant receptor n=1 Tax=Melipona quadrifasciata TaxID=166423 RepID=A0A0M8ZYI3_9HYME|nr:hypothetical protein WN51_13773 [Melipona quadrifasciata]